jgi:O-acetyl-ADP-ribose deacetylase (regulator of RNase III)
MKIKATIYRLLGYKTIDELLLELKEGKRHEIDSKALANAKKLSMALMPKGLFYPTGGEVFEALADTEINYMTHFMAPYTGGAKAILLKGERVIVSKPNRGKPISYYCDAINFIEVEKRIVPSLDRDEPAYNGYSLSIGTKSLNKDFRQIELMAIKYVKGDATSPLGHATKIITHICNDVGGWGKGFVLAISNKWKNPEAEYRNWFNSKELNPTDTVQFERLEWYDRYSNEKEFKLGNVQFIKADNDTWIANMIAQTGIKPNKDGEPPIRYTFVRECLARVKEFAKRHNASIHMPRIGCGLAGGEWSEIEPIIKHELIAHEIDVTVYDFN